MVCVVIQTCSKSFLVFFVKHYKMNVASCSKALFKHYKLSCALCLRRRLKKFLNVKRNLTARFSLIVSKNLFRKIKLEKQNKTKSQVPNCPD